MVETYVPDFGTGKYKVFGNRLPNITAFERVVGRSMYDYDFRPQNMLYAASLRSPYAHATIVSMDTSAAEALPGVKLVMNYFNFPKVFIQPEIFYAGEEVGAVVADSLDTCYKALQLIKVEYNKLPAAYDMYEAQKEGAPIVLKNATSNLRWTTGGFFSNLTPEGLWKTRVTQEIRGFGDAQAAMKTADTTIQVKDMRSNCLKSPIPHGLGCTADYTGDDPSKQFTYYQDSKGLYADRNKLAAITGTPIGKAQLISPYGGGLWGVMLMVGDRREKAGPISCWASLTLNQPVYHHYLYHEEEIRNVYKQSQSNIQIGFKKTGEIVSWIGEHLDCSGTQDSSAESGSERSTPMLQYNRVCRDMSLHAGRVAANFPGNFQDYVGYSCYTGIFAAEMAMDVGAEALNMDPIDVRKVNCMKKGLFDAHWNTALAQCSNEGHRECLDAVAATANWKSVWTGWAGIKAKTGPIKHGIGVALKIHTGGGWAGTAMLTKMFPDGSFECVSSVGDSGQNEPMAAVMITAECLGLPYERGSMTRGSTSQPYSIMLGGSTGTWNHGYATWEAAMNVRKQVLGLGAELYPDASGKPVDISLLDMDQGGVFLKSDPTKKQTFSNVFARLASRNTADGKATFENRSGSFEVAAYAYRRATEGLVIPREKGAAIWNLDVDTETGEILNLHCATADNIGKICQPHNVENQQSQGANHGGPWSLWCEKIYDPASGRDLSYNWIYDYPSTHMDLDTKFHIIEIPGDVTHPFGMTAASEGQPNPHPGAIANAIYNAIGVRMHQAPFTPDKVLKALKLVV